MKLWIFAVVGFSLVTPISLWAEEGAAEGKGPCRPDVEKFCKDVKPGHGRIIKCLKEHEAELSAECKAHGQAIKAEVKEARLACKADAEKFCKDVKPGRGHIMKCLSKHEAELSAECKKEREELHDLRKPHHKEKNT